MTDQTLLQYEDDASRQRALDLESFIVEAPAGAGKTELLTQRFLKLLQFVDAPEEVVAITFTNKAAAEMRSRILDSLLMAESGELPDKAHKQTTFDLACRTLQHARQLGWNLLQNPARLRIYTIDSLSSSLARQMPLMSRFGAQPAVTEDAETLYEEAAQRALDLLDDETQGQAVRRVLRHFDNDAYRLGSLLVEMLKRRDQWLTHTQGCLSKTAEAAEAALSHLIGQDIASASQTLDVRLQKTLMPAARYAAGNLPCDEPVALLRDWETVMPATVEALPMWRAAGELLLTESGTLRKIVTVKQGFPSADESRPFKAIMAEVLAALQDVPGAENALARLCQLPQARHSDEIWQVIDALAQLLNIAVGQLWVVFQEHGEVDFVEVASRALQALEDESGAPTDLALKLDYRICHLLVDEFQDTSPTQIKLLENLTRGWMQGDDRTLFAVGDPMQSIYRFRKANVGLFLDVAEYGIGDVRLQKLRLCRNNRSCPPVVSWVNQAFRQIFPRDDSVSRGAIAYREFVATKVDEPGTGVFVHPLIAASGEANEAIWLREADQIVRIIQQEQKAHPERKIAVLVRARSHLHTLVAEIRRSHKSLRFQAVEIEDLANRQVMQDLLSLTYALHNRADRLHWLAVLRAPWCGLKLDDLHKLAVEPGGKTVWMLMQDEARLRSLSGDGRKRLLHVRDIFAEALANRGRQSPGRWVHAVWLMLGGPDCLWETGDVRDVQAFFLRVEQMESAGQFSVQQLAMEMEKLYAAPDAEAPDRLQFMTIHKSKGLEFDTVILPGLERQTRGSDQPLLLWEEVALENDRQAQTELVVAPYVPKGARNHDLPTAYDYLGLLEKERAASEDARVLYVAATRAERSLHLVGSARLGAKNEPRAPANSFLNLLWPVVAGKFREATENPPETKPAGEKLPDIAAFVPKLVRLENPAMPAFLQAGSGMDAAREKGTVLAGIENEDVIFGRSLEADIGTLAHRYMELIARQGLTNWLPERIAGLRPAMRHWLHSRGHAPLDAERGVDQVAAVLEISLASKDGQWVLQARQAAASELALAAVAGEGVAGHVIDRTFVENGVRWIIDYKSAALAEGISQRELEAIAGNYREQLERYEKLFSNEGLPVRKAVFFLSAGRLALL